MQQVNELNSARVAAAFDSIAPSFGETLENEITREIREEVYRTIDSLVPAGSRILDLNCGIGIDTLALTRRGFRTIGVDISPGMIGQARKRAKKTGVADAEFAISSFDDLSMLAAHSFDLVLSNFGGLNCNASLERCAAEVARAIRPGGYFVAIVMPTFSLWEAVAGVTRLNFRSAFRRLRSSVEATGFRGNTFSVYYHSPRSFRRFFSPWFTVRALRGMNIISPPPHATRFRAEYPGLSSFLEQLEPSVARLPFLRSMGDHYMMVLQREIHG